MPRVEEDLLQRRPFRSDKERLMVTIMRTSAWLCDEFNRELEPYGISQQQYNVLRILRGSSEPLSTCDIRRRMIDRASDTSRIVDRLVEKGLVEKQSSVHDRRRIEVRLTTAGLELLETLEPIVRRFHDHAAILTPDQRRQVAELLDLLRSAGNAHN
ncbi:MAG: MarR family transcriptional regulator [Chlorobiota bacterium]|jgi:DNA-binding MarR family transcriptional regulator|nr:MAG: MarR family transcriptional regulator [Chlorobiota bacterium]